MKDTFQVVVPVEIQIQTTLDVMSKRKIVHLKEFEDWGDIPEVPIPQREASVTAAASSIASKETSIHETSPTKRTSRLRTSKPFGIIYLSC